MQPITISCFSIDCTNSNHILRVHNKNVAYASRSVEMCLYIYREDYFAGTQNNAKNKSRRLRTRQIQLIVLFDETTCFCATTRCVIMPSSKLSCVYI